MPGVAKIKGSNLTFFEFLNCKHSVSIKLLIKFSCAYIFLSA